MLDLKRVRPLDAVIIAVAALVIILGAYLGYSVWASKRALVASTPAARAIADLEAKVRANPNDLPTRMNLAQAYAVGARDNDAVAQYKAILSVNKDYVPALSGLGFIALKQKQYKTGENYYRKIIELLAGDDSKGAETALEIAHHYLGISLMEQKRYEEAAGELKQALRYRRDASDTHYALAVTLRELGLEDGYRDSLQNALLFDPKMPEANYDYGNLLLKDGKKADAAEYFRRSADAAPAVDLPVKALEKLGPFSDRLAEAKKYLKSEPAKALEAGRIAAAIDPRSVEASLLVARTYEELKQNQRAVAWYKRVLALEPDNASAKAGLKRVDDGS